MFFFFNDTATTEIYTLSLHDALPIWVGRAAGSPVAAPPSSSVLRSSFAVMPGGGPSPSSETARRTAGPRRSEEHTSELQSQSNLVCRLLLAKKKAPNLGTWSIQRIET